MLWLVKGLSAVETNIIAMRLAVTPIISIIILLGIGVAIAGVAFSVISNYAGGYTKKMIEINPGSFSCIDGEVTMFIKNPGTTPIILPDTLGQVEEYSPDANTILLMHFDEGSGIDANDISGNANHGTLLPPGSEPAWVDGVFGKALQFDGADDFVEIADSPSLAIANDITIEMWVKTQPYTGWRALMSKFHGTGPPRKDIYIYLYGGQFGFALAGPRDADWNTSLPVNINEWTHIAIVYNGSDMSVYRNGALVNSLPATGSLDISLPDSTEPVYLGYVSEWTNENFTGVIDEVRISDVARDFSTNQPGLGYLCSGVGVTRECGDILITRKQGNGEFVPYFEDTIIPTGLAVAFKDRCTGRCEYVFATSSVSKTIRLSC